MKTVKSTLITVFLSLFLSTAHMVTAGKISLAQAIALAKKQVAQQCGETNRAVLDNVLGQIQREVQKNSGVIEESFVDQIIDNALVFFSENASRLSSIGNEDIDNELELALALSMTENNDNSIDNALFSPSAYNQVEENDDELNQALALSLQPQQDFTAQTDTELAQQIALVEGENNTIDDEILARQLQDQLTLETGDNNNNNNDDNTFVVHATAEQPHAQLDLNQICLQAYQQQGPSCGYHATCNAKAIQDLFVQGQPITAKTILQKAQQYHTHLGNNELETQEIVHLAEKIGLNNMYFLRYENGVQGAGIWNETTVPIDQLQLMFRTNTSSHCAHFICNTGGHWVLISIVKEINRRPRIIYLDSNNGPVPADSTQYKFIHYIWNLIRN